MTGEQVTVSRMEAEESGFDFRAEDWQEEPAVLEACPAEWRLERKRKTEKQTAPRRNWWKEWKQKR